MGSVVRCPSGAPGSSLHRARVSSDLTKRTFEQDRRVSFTSNETTCEDVRIWRANPCFAAPLGSEFPWVVGVRLRMAAKSKVRLEPRTVPAVLMGSRSDRILCLCRSIWGQVAAYGGPPMGHESTWARIQMAAGSLRPRHATNLSDTREQFDIFVVTYHAVNLKTD